MTFTHKLSLSIFVLLTGFANGALAPQPQADEELLVDASGEEIQQIVESFEGDKAVLLNVWATWCAPCVEEFPEIVKIQRQYEDELKVIFVSADFPDSRDRALKFLKEQGVDWTTYFKTGKDMPFIEALSSEWNGALPFTKIVNKSGEVTASWQNSATFSKFESEVQKAINP